MSGVFGRVRLLGFGLLAVTFVVGALAGVAVDRVVSDDGAATEARRDRRDNGRGHSYLIDRLDLSDVQRATIDSILERRTKRMRAVWRDVEPQLDAITDSARSEIMEVLTPDQRSSYEELLERRRRSRDGDSSGEQPDSGRSSNQQEGH